MPQAIDGEALIANPRSLEPTEAVALIRHPTSPCPNNIFSIILPDDLHPPPLPKSDKKFEPPPELAALIGVKHKLIILRPSDIIYKQARDLVFRIVMLVYPAKTVKLSDYDMPVQAHVEIEKRKLKMVNYCYYAPRHEVPAGVPTRRLIFLYDLYDMQAIQYFRVSMEEYRRYAKNGDVCIEVMLHNYNPSPTWAYNDHWSEELRRPPCPSKYRLSGKNSIPKAPKSDTLYKAFFRENCEDAIEV